MNSKLYNLKYPIPPEIIKNVNFALHKFSDNGEGVKRAKFIINNGYATYQMLKRLKNFFENPDKIKSTGEYQLAGGELMHHWVEHKLSSERKSVKGTDQSRHDMKSTKDNVASLRPQTELSINESEDIKDVAKCSVAILFNPRNQVLLLKRGLGAGWQPGKWAFVGGIIEDGETPLQAMRREIYEETNLQIEKLTQKFIIKRENIVEFVFAGTIPLGIDNMIVLDDENDDWGVYSIHDLEKIDAVPNIMDYLRIVFDNSDYTQN